MKKLPREDKFICKGQITSRGHITYRRQDYPRWTELLAETMFTYKMTNIGQNFLHNTRLTMDNTITKRRQAILHKTR